MAEDRVQRRLAAIVSADVVGYSKMMGQDEAGTLARLKSLRAELLHPQVAAYGGRIVKTTGDGTLIEFGSAVDAVSHAVDVQRAMAERNADLPEDRQIRLRLGINVGDIIIDGDDIFGDGVNVAARLEAMAEPGGICLSARVHDYVGDRLEVGFEDLGKQSLKNIAEPVQVYRVRPGGPAASKSAEGKAASPPSAMPSIAVLPFDNMSGDPEQEHFADGLVEDIITTLSKLSGLVVIARNSSFVYKGRAVDVRQAAAELGVRYVLEGSVRKSGNRIRITAQLIDATTGSHVWAERYDRSLDDIFAVQDEITLVLATELQVKLTEGEQARLRYTTTDNVEAWTCWVEGMSYFRQAVTKEAFGRGRPCWEKALALDPNSAPLNAMLGFMHYADARFGWWDDRETALKKCRDYADRALALDPENADAYTTSSLHHMVLRQHEAAVADARQAVALAPGSADTAMFASFVLANAGHADEAVVQIERAMTLSPNYSPQVLGHLGNAYRLTGRIDDAIDAFIEYDKRHAGFGLTDLVIAYRQKGEADLAKRTAERLLAARPNLTVKSWLNTQFRNDTERLEADAEALRSAGIPMG